MFCWKMWVERRCNLLVAFTSQETLKRSVGRLTEGVANASSEVNFVAICKRLVVNRAVGNIAIGEAVVSASSEGKISLAISTDVARNASANEGVESDVTVTD